jgi:hypothetical protein
MAVIAAREKRIMTRFGAIFAGYVRWTTAFSVTEDDLWIWIVAALACATGIAAGYALDALI